MASIEIPPTVVEVKATVDAEGQPPNTQAAAGLPPPTPPPPSQVMATPLNLIGATQTSPPKVTSTPKNSSSAPSKNTSTGAACENRYFYEDEVFRMDANGRIRFGLVMETFDASYSDTEPTQSDLEDILQKGEVRVVWHPRGHEEVMPEMHLGLADRTLMPGDVVRRMIPGKDTQKGYCREVTVKADVNIKGTSYIIKNVSADRLRPLLTTMRDNAVCLDSWVGSTRSINLKLILKTACGSVLELRPDQEYTRLRDTDTLNREGYFAVTSFYPGQTLVGPISALCCDSTKWISNAPDSRNTRKRTSFSVMSVETEGISVTWQCKALSDAADAVLHANQPKSYVTGDDLKRLRRLNIFESCMQQINDKNYLTIDESDLRNMTRRKQWRKERSVFFEGQNVPKPKAKKRTELKAKEKQQQQHQQTAGAKVPHSPTTFDDSCLAESEGWVTEEDDDDNGSVNGCFGSLESLTTGSSCCSSPTPRSSPKRSPLFTKKMKKLQKQINQKLMDVAPKLGAEVVTETTVVYSSATVVWQDGTIEEGISSCDLYPIHHLDEHEFFPGDFVLAGVVSDDVSYRDYGVIQRVNYIDRTAIVKWFSTYTNSGTPVPTFFNETEVSVYDLKDHPDFQYRPGTIVIRVANFTGEDSSCTAGQVVDNYAEGRVKVWWVDGHYSMCWPQDLFEVGNYDSDNNYWLSGDSDNGSWETDSTRSEPGSPSSTGDYLGKVPFEGSLDRAMKAMINLEGIFNDNPNLENHETMHKLMDVYKKCRFIDRLLDTNFFHESKFMGLIERVRRASSHTAVIRAIDHRNRLFSESPAGPPIVAITSPPAQHPLKMPPISPIGTPHVKSSIKQKQYKITRPETYFEDPASTPQLQFHDDSNPNTFSDSEVASSLNNASQIATTNNKVESPSLPSGHTRHFGFVINESAMESSNQSHSLSAHDSGFHTKSFECGEASGGSSYELLTATTDASLSKHEGDHTSNSCCSIEGTDKELSDYACARLCTLLKAQLELVLKEIKDRYNLKLSESQQSTEAPTTVQETTAASSVEPDLVTDAPHLNTNIQTELISDSVESTLHTAAPSLTPIASIPEDSVYFTVVESAPPTHHFFSIFADPVNAAQYYRTICFDHNLLQSSMPPGVWIRIYEDRMDLMSVMIEGPEHTPYEDGMFLFDIQMGKNYPRSPPTCHYVSFCADRLNPNLYEDGKVCVSLLGTWSGKGSEVWGPSSTLLQVIVSIQGLILVPEPYFNEAGYEKQKGSQQGTENSRMYNEMVIIKMVQSTTKLLQSPPEVFRQQIEQHFSQRGMAMYERIKGWMAASDTFNNPNSENSQANSAARPTADGTVHLPQFSLLPASRGFCLTLRGLLENFRLKVEELNRSLANKMVVKDV